MVMVNSVEDGLRVFDLLGSASRTLIGTPARSARIGMRRRCSRCRLQIGDKAQAIGDRVFEVAIEHRKERFGCKGRAKWLFRASTLRHCS